MQNNKIKVISFDAGGTLIAPSLPVGHIYAQIAWDSCAIRLDPDLLEAGFRSSFKTVPPVLYNGYPMTSSSKTWWKRLVQQVITEAGGIGAFDREGFFDLYFEKLYLAFLEPERWMIFPEVHQVLDQCRNRGLKTIVLSNWDERLHPILGSLGLSNAFDQIIVSCEVGVEKPGREIFDYALDRMGIAPEEMLHIGDSQREDEKGAFDAGIKGIFIQRPQSDLRVVWEYL